MFKYIQIETTTFCNAKCWFCPNHLAVKEHMDMDMIRGIIDSTRNLGITYRPFGLGDPLVDTRMGEICRYIQQDRTATVELHTNGEPLNEKTELNLAPYVDRMRFSIDGITKATFDESRGINFDRVYANAERFIRNNPHVECEVRMIDLPGTESEQRDYLDHWNGIRPGCASITQLYRHPWEDQTDSVALPCRKAENEAFVYVNGDVHLCPWDFGKRDVIGNVADASITDIWNGNRYAEYRSLLQAGRRCDISLCSRCDADFGL